MKVLRNSLHIILVLYFKKGDYLISMCSYYETSQVYCIYRTITVSNDHQLHRTWTMWCSKFKNDVYGKQQVRKIYPFELLLIQKQWTKTVIQYILQMHAMPMPSRRQFSNLLIELPWFNLDHLMCTATTYEFLFSGYIIVEEEES